MRPFSFVGIFCEDIRDEVSGTHTIVGVLPDNINIGGLPGMLPKLGIYIRIQIDKDANPKTLKARMKVPGAGTFEVADFENLIASAKQQAEEKGTPFAGLIAKGSFTPLPISELGRIEAIVEIDGTEYICGVLNLIQPEAAIEASAASAPPASPPASAA
jgi:hypothetical protein